MSLDEITKGAKTEQRFHIDLKNGFSLEFYLCLFRKQPGIYAAITKAVFEPDLEERHFRPCMVLMKMHRRLYDESRP